MRKKERNMYEITLLQFKCLRIHILDIGQLRYALIKVLIIHELETEAKLYTEKCISGQLDHLGIAQAIASHVG